jgi:hypothetical protein
METSKLSQIVQFWNDESGFVLTAEAVLLGTVGVVGATVGLSAMAQTMNDELSEVAMSFRSLNQSYCIPEQHGCHAWTAGSFYIQKPVEVAQAELQADINRWEDEAIERQKQFDAEAQKQHEHHNLMPSKEKPHDHHRIDVPPAGNKVDGDKKEGMKKDGEHQIKDGDKKVGDSEKKSMNKKPADKPDMKKPEAKKKVPQKKSDSKTKDRDNG